MNTMNFLLKSLKSHYDNSAYNGIFYEKPQTCPHCSINTDASIVSTNNYSYGSETDGRIFIFLWRCTVCQKLFSSFTLFKDKKCTYLGVFPPPAASYYSDKSIEEVSPRFIEMYNQALRAEDNGDFNLAAVGMRSALEILIKDYAINCLGKNKEDVVGLSLFNAISEFLDNGDYINVADVIRILGNDHTHYDRKYPQYDYEILRNYMNIFISLIKNKILIKNPPVSR